ncbi:hypothetical protein HPB51_004243 [Rhipicephalus microplus]|uniref:Carboxylesterase type B domain-containing protein n=1 Tax=Rhipicephalus microplus TaxID=6941 RepID=A0A9J6EQQ4_RHIMP|nr:hypothetical protein HPB51_004243 [Rhipicephalus microplus]
MTAMADVVMVKMNYRLGAFGFLYGAHEYAPGNMGLYDQYLALLFVLNNIELFGGDPNKITAFGNSAGAMSIGLMKYAETGRAPQEHFVMKHSNLLVEAWLTTVGGPQRHVEMMTSGGSHDPSGKTEAAGAYPQFFRRESHSKVSNSEMFETCNRTFLHNFSKSQLRRIFCNYMGLRGHTTFLKLRDILSSCIADYFLVCPAHHFARALSRKGADVYFYLFAYRTKNSLTPPWMGVVHTSELFYLFGEPCSTSWYTDEERAFSRTMVDIWSTFARTGCEDSKDTKIWDLDQLHEKQSTFEDTTCTNVAHRITGFGRRFWGAKPCGRRRRVCVRRLAQHHSTEFLKHFLTDPEVDEHATGDKSCRKKLKNVAPQKSRVEMPRRQTECTYAEKDFPQLEQHQQKPPCWFSSEREEATLQKRQTSRSSSRSRSRSRSTSKTPQQRNINKPAEAPG